MMVRIYLCSISPQNELVYLIPYLGQAIPQTHMSAQGLAAFSAKLFFSSRADREELHRTSPRHFIHDVGSYAASQASGGIYPG
jgi:hypothetical protein